MGQKTVLLTGAAGFIGSHVAERLLSRGDRVIGLDNFNNYYDPAIKQRNAASLSERPGFSLVTGDVRDASLLRRLFSEHRFQAVIHLAAMAGVRASVDDPELYFDVNVTGTLRLLEAARQQGKPNFIFASTSSAYGRTTRVPFREEHRTAEPLAPYPASKLSGELLGHAYHHGHGMDFTALRFFTVYGPRNRPDMLPYLTMESIRTGREIPLYEGGQMWRDWTFVSDIADGVVRAADVRLGYEIINLGRGEPVLLRDYVEELSRLAGKQPNFVSAKMPAADVPLTVANIDKAKRLLGYAPSVSVKDGVRAFFEWYRSVSP